MTSKPKKVCFVVGPIGEPGTDTRKHADWLLDGIIKPVFENYGDFVVVRADEIVAPGKIASQVINKIWDADLVIADMSFHNANAFYELAIAHMRHRPTIHMIRRDFDIPFDVAPYRAITFSTDEYKDLDEARRTLNETVDAALKEKKIENPVTHARGVFDLAEHADPAVKVVVAEVQELRRRVDQMEASSAARLARTLHPSLVPSESVVPGVGMLSGGLISRLGRSAQVVTPSFSDIKQKEEDGD